MFEEYEAWLHTQYESKATVNRAVRDIKLIARADDRVTTPTSKTRAKQLGWAWDTYHWYVENNPGARKLKSALEPPPPVAVTSKRRTRKEYAVRSEAIPEDQYKELIYLIQNCKKPGVEVLEVLCRTSLRTQDVMRVQRDALKAGLKHPNGIMTLRVKGNKPIKVSVEGARDSWERLHKAMLRDKVDQASETCVGTEARTRKDYTSCSGAPRKAVDRLLKKLGEEAGVEGRIHLHRMRRTIAAYAWLASSDKRDVQALLGHEQLKQTELYAEDARALLAGRTLARVHKQLDDEDDG